MKIMNILFYWFLFFTIISFGFYIFFSVMPINDTEDLIIRHYVLRWLVINLILISITGGYKFYNKK